MTSIAALIPTRNRRELVCRAVRSALGQTHPPDEIVVVDDGSTDGAGEAVLELDPRVRVVRTPGLGAAGARNAGARAATTDWLALLDSDDVWLPHHLGSIAHALAATPAPPPALVFADADLPADGTTAFRRAGFELRAPVTRTADAAAWALLPVQPIMTPATAIRRADWLAVGGMGERLACREDTDLFLRLALARLPFIALTAPGACVERRDVSLSRLHGPSSDTYWRATAALYAGCLDGGGGDVATRRELRRRLATAEWRLSRSAWQSRRPGRAMRTLLASVGHDPGVAAGRFGRRRA